ncbi:MAG: hypothetical protein JKY56_15185 [Kofleriaceae bacterium]|nr:hypothetical protein [Kofleriaceae bacterium]
MSNERSVAELEAEWLAASPGPAAIGRICLIVTRASAADMPAGQNKLTTPMHTVPDCASFTIRDGLHGDRWKPGKTPESQISLTSLSVARLVAGTSDRFHLFGNNFVVDLDLSLDSLPVDSRLVLGSGEIEVSDEAHTPCDRYEARFGSAAYQWVDDETLARRCLRGRYARVIRDGEVSVNGKIRVISR